MSSTTKKPLLDCILGNTPSRPPIWFLRQAGRYLPEYRAIRSQMSFLELCRNPQKAAEVTLQPLERFDIDGAIIFSDILIPPIAMGQDLVFAKDHGPILNPTIRSEADLKNLKMPDVEKEVGYVGEAIAATKAKLPADKTMIGFAGAPYTVASYMIEGSGSKTYTEVKRLLFKTPEVFTKLLEMLSEVTADYIKMQVNAGADMIMLFDSWAGHLSSVDYRAHVVPATSKLIDRIKAECNVPVVYYPGQGSDNLAELSGMNMDAVHVDWRTRISRAWRILNNESNIRPTIQGNIDPQCFLGNEDFVRSRVQIVKEEVKKAKLPHHIFNVGHGLLPHTPVEALTWAIDEFRLT